MIDDVLPSTTEVKESTERFEPDYKYAADSDIRQITTSQLAKLEADLHNLRMMFVANGKNPELMVNEHRTIVEEMDTIKSLIKRLEEYFAEVL